MPFSSQQQGGGGSGSAATVTPRHSISYIFEDLARYTTSVANSATVAVNGNGCRLITNSGSGGQAGVTSNFPYNFPLFDKKPSISFNLAAINGEAGSGFYTFGMMDNAGASDIIYESVGDRKGAWITKKVVAGAVTWYACVSDGSNVTATPFAMSSNNNAHNFTIDFTADGVKFYADGTLKVTITTTIPTGGNSTFQSGFLYAMVRNNPGDSSQRIFDIANAQITYDS